MAPCESSVYITAIACQLFKCLSKDELAILSANLVELGDTLAAMLTRYEICQANNEE